MTLTAPAPLDQTRVEAFTNQVFADLAACYGGVMVTLGDRLGLYEAMADGASLTSREVADRASSAERYVREWLASQVAAGYIEYDPLAETYRLPPEHAAVLADRASPTFMPIAFNVPASMWLDEDRAVATFRTGDGVAWGDHHDRLHAGVAGFYRNGYRASLVDEWLPALDGVVERLTAGARVADVGCGHGHSTVLMAQAFPRSTFVGIDPHPASIAAAREYAAAAGVTDRVRFEVATATSYQDREFDLIAFFDCLHDLGDPVGAAAHAHSALADGGTVMLVEPNAGDSIMDNVGPVGRVYYSASTTVCVAHALSEPVGRALGAQAGEARLRAVFAEAGFGHWRRAAATPFNLILEARA
jgi:SAM-dependent methyltransferase